VVELLHRFDRGCQALLIALRFGRETPRVGERFEVGERRGKHAHRVAPSYSSNHSPTTLCRWRHSTSWSLSGKRSIQRVSSIDCVASSVFASCRANSLKVTAAISCAMRSRTVVAGLKYTFPSKMCV